MTDCPACGHERLGHDAWGCKYRCGCLVSIIYITSKPSPPPDHEVVKEMIRQGNELVIQADRLAESRYEAMRARAVAEAGTTTEQGR